MVHPKQFLILEMAFAPALMLRRAIMRLEHTHESTIHCSAEFVFLGTTEGG